MKQFNALLLFLALCCSFTATAQQRYLDPIFDNVTVTSDIVYGVNATVLALPQVGEAIPRPLLLDVYEPVGDDLTERPLVLLFHTGNFLPHPQNGSVGGLKTDSSVVEAATQLARRGFVAVSIDYRLGWNPIAPNQDERVFTLINAVYRAMQDARTAIRFFKKDARDSANSFGVDTTRITLWGHGSGGYVVNAVHTLDDFNKVFLPKFTTEIGGQPFPMVIEAVNGDIYGTSVGEVPAGYPGFPEGDTLCYPNWVTYDNGEPIGSDYQLTINLGGALGDSSWIDSGQNPWITFHNPDDPDAPYVEGIVNVPGIGLPVVEVQGGLIIQTLQNQFGNNEPFAAATFLDDLTPIAMDRSGGLEGLFPIPGGEDRTAPWQFYAPDNVNATEPPMPEAAKSYMTDTIIPYFTPRACLTLDLGCNLEGIVSSVETILPGVEVGLKMAPNPALESVFLQTEVEFPMQELQLFDMNGRLVQSNNRIDDNSFILQRGNLPTGIYVARIRFKEGIVAKRIMFQ